MVRTGLLAIESGESRLDGVLLAIKGGNPNPLRRCQTPPKLGCQPGLHFVKLPKRI